MNVTAHFLFEYVGATIPIVVTSAFIGGSLGPITVKDDCEEFNTFFQKRLRHLHKTGPYPARNIVMDKIKYGAMRGAGMGMGFGGFVGMFFVANGGYYTRLSHEAKELQFRY